ncbi:type VII secretion integral membrane protein EccD [Rhodococcus sp. OK519]|uniref:type VII secretion integral membrane protein EccD n=1 Tax=Rhodococcus sp. OK519 TaxID=2135729 RepID=UPI003B96BDE2
MTVLRDDQMPNGTTGARPRGVSDLCRLTILAPHTQIDLALPNSVPVELLVPGIADMVERHSAANDFAVTDDRIRPSRWTLSRVGRPPLSPTSSLQDNGVLDGELLVFDSIEASPPQPLFDDIMYNVAVADTGHAHPWSPRIARLTGSTIAIVAATAGAFTLLRTDGATAALIGAVGAFAVVVAFLVAGAIANRVYDDAAAAVTLGVAALPVSFAAGALAVPGDLAPPHVLFGLVMVGASAVLALRAGGVGHAVFSAAVSFSLLGSLATLTAVLTEQSARSVGSMLIGGALVGLVFAPRLAMMLAKLPLPPVPAPGTSIDPTEDDPDDTRSTPSFAAVALRADHARRYLTGLVAGMTLLAVGGALLVSFPTEVTGIYWPGVALAVATSAVLSFRGRTYSSAEQAVPLIAGGSAVPVLLAAATAAMVPSTALPLFAATSLLVVSASVLGIVVPHRTFSPVQRRAAEFVDYAAIASVIPLVCWVSGLFTAVRGL